MKPSRVKKIWEEEGIALGTLVKSSDPVHTEVFSQMGLDFLWYDLEHSDKSLESFSHLTRAARLGQADVLARPAKGEYMRMGRLLEAGAHGIMYPRCESAEEAREVVKWAKFHPQGERGFDGGSADNNYGGQYPAGEYTQRANANTWLLAQIESPAALNEVQGIAEVDGIDCLFFGPGDFSVLSGRPGQIDHPDSKRAAETVAKAAHASGKEFGSLVFNAEQARFMIDIGAKLLVHSADILFLRAAYEELLNLYSQLREEVDGPILEKS